ncbi:hypothetical protein [Thalassospira lucentensis]|uniref:hypothetical protein n=1 Tax=Thalassospira lucentensis TaxID=168935 RepID=UPI003D2A7135|tara:strand:+ start:190930 stop:191292 length:363 start_codon:yes stop_codon:yes gene_type:complete
MPVTIPAWVKPGIWGGIIGAALITIVGFSTDTVVSGSTAQEMADDSGKQSAIAAMAPICVAQFKMLTPNNQTEQLAALKEESSYKRDDFVIARGWATMPGSDAPTDEIAASCASLLMELS